MFKRKIRVKLTAIKIVPKTTYLLREFVSYLAEDDHTYIFSYT